MSGLDAQQKSALGVCMAVVALVGLYWSPMLSYWFTATDTLTLIEAAAAPGALTRAWVAPLMEGSAFAKDFLYFRPVTTLSFALDHAVWGLDPFGYHLTDLLLHMGCVALVFRLAWQMSGRQIAAAAVAALAFGLHPALLDVVPAIARRQDPLAVLLMLIAWSALAQARGRRGLQAASVLAMVAAMLAKEVAFVFPAMVLGWAWAEGAGPSGPRLRAALRGSAPWLTAAALTFLWRAAVLSGVGGGGGQGINGQAAVAYTRNLLALSPLELLTGPPTLAWWATGLVLSLTTVLLMGLTLPREADAGGPAPVHRRARAAGAVLTLLLGLPTLATLMQWAPAALADSGLLEATRGGGQPEAVYIAAIADDLLGGPLGLAAAAGLMTLLVAACVASPVSARYAPRVGAALLLPLALYVLTGVSEVRLMYLPAALLGLLLGTLVPGVVALATGAEAREGEEGRLTDKRRLTLAAMATLPLVLTLVTGPLVADPRHWRASGEISRQVLTELSAQREALPEGGQVALLGLPISIYDLALAPGAPRSVSWPSGYAITSWLALDAGVHATVNAAITPLRTEPTTVRLLSLEGRPDQAVFEISCEGGQP